MEDVETQKEKLRQKKNELAAEEVRLNLKERKMRTRHLIEIGGLIVKANLDHLPSNTLYGALLSLSEALKDDDAIKAAWTTKGNSAFNKEKQLKIAIILKFEQQPSNDIRNLIRTHGLKWNKLRQEWYGYCHNVNSLKNDLGTSKYQIEEL